MGVQVNFIAGYTDKTLVPRHLKQAILILVGHWYENREEAASGRPYEEIPLGARDLLSRNLPQLVG
jgi:uncharacterized phiE125 gp8 family phage protein